MALTHARGSGPHLTHLCLAPAPVPAPATTPATQVDFFREARNLARFNRNFRRARAVSFPTPLYPLVAPDVLVESFESGR
jgi:aarF domain-containing kinase